MARVSLGTTTTAGATQTSNQRKIVKTSLNKLVLFALIAGHIEYKTSIDDGDTWDSSWTIVYNSTIVTLFDIRIETNNDICIVFTSDSGGAVRFIRLIYSSGTWTNGSVVLISAETCNAGLSIARRSNGDFWIGGGQNGASLFSAYSIDNGVTWTRVQLSTSTSSPVVIISKGTYIWLFNFTSGVLHLWQYDSSWDSGTTIVSSGVTNGILGILKISDSEIYIACRSSVGIKLFTYNGSTWSTSTTLSDHSNDTDPTLCNLNGYPILIWKDYDPISTFYNIYYRSYNGSTWDSERALTNDSVVDSFPTTMISDLQKIYLCYTTGNSSPYTIYFDRLGTILSDFIFKSDLLKIQEDTYKFKSRLLKYITDSYLFKSILVKSYILTATLLGNIKSSFLLKATLLKTQISSYLLKSIIVSVLKNLYTSYLIFDEIGLLSTGTQVGGSKISSGSNLLSKVYIYLKSTGSSGNTIIDINITRDGVKTSIFTNPLDRPIIIYNDLNKFVEVDLDIKLAKNDIISIDIDEVAVNAEELSVIMHLDSYTGLKPKILESAILDDTFLLNDNDVWVTDKLRAKIRFENMMDITVIPTVYLIKNDGAKTLLTGSWSSEMVKYDTFITDSIEITENDIGNAAISIAGARDKYNITMDEFQKNFTITSFAKKIDYNKWSKISNVNLTLGIISKQFSYSLNDITYITPIDWEDVITINITNSSVGGTSTEENKTIYLKFITGLTSCKKIINIKYFYSPMSEWSATFQKRIINNTINNEYVSFIKLPVTAQQMPIKYVRVYQGEDKIAEINKLQTYVDNGLDLWWAYQHTDFDLGTDKFTFENFIYFTNLSGRQVIYSVYKDALNYWYIEKDATNRIHIYILKGGIPSGEYYSPILSLSINTWYHLEINRDGIICRISLDGIFQTITQITPFISDLNLTLNTDLYIGKSDLFSSNIKAHLDEIRFSKGICRHISNFTPTTIELISDEYTYLLLHGNLDRDENTFIDETGRRTDDISSGGVTFSSSIKKLGNGSLKFNGSTGFLKAASSNGYTYNNKSLILALESGTIILSSGEVVIKEKTFFKLNPVISASRYDLICINEIGEYVVVEGIEGEIRTKPPYINDLSYTSSKFTWPEVPFYPESYIPLYAILIKYEKTKSSSYIDKEADFYHFDLRPTSIFIRATLSETEESANEDAIPTMTGYFTPLGIVSESSSQSGYEGWKALDDNIVSTKWLTSNGILTGWLSYEFTEKILIGKYSIIADSIARAPKNWTFEGWTGSTWEILDIRTGETFITEEEKMYYVSNPGAYIKYRINITLNNGDINNLGIRELKLIFSNSNVRVEIEDAAGRLDSKDFYIKLININQNISKKILRAYSDPERTIPVISGEITTSSKIYLSLEEGF